MKTAIKQIREERGLTQDQLASLSRVPRICISRYENGKYYPSIENALKLAGALNVPLEALLIDKKAG